MTARGKQGRFRRAVFYVVAIVLPFVVLELVSFLAFLAYDQAKGPWIFHPLARSANVARPFVFDPFLAYRLRPGLIYDDGRDFGPLNINSDGFIDNGGGTFPDLDRAPEKATRVFVFGGSTVAGFGALSNRATIPALMERILNDNDGGNYEVINAGVPGYFSYGELAYLLADVVRYHPDVVVFYNGWNDFAYPVWEGGYVDRRQKMRAHPNNHSYAAYLAATFQERRGLGSRVFCHPFFNRFYTMGLVRKLARYYFDAMVLCGPEDIAFWGDRILVGPEEAAASYAHNINNILAAGSGLGLKTVIGLQPSIVHKQRRSADEDRIFVSDSQLAGDGGLGDVGMIRRYFATARQALRELSRRYDSQNARVVDPSLSMWRDVGETIYVDSIHTNDRGNLVIARGLAALVSDVAKAQEK